CSLAGVVAFPPFGDPMKTARRFRALLVWCCLAGSSAAAQNHPAPVPPIVLQFGDLQSAAAGVPGWGQSMSIPEYNDNQRFSAFVVWVADTGTCPSNPIGAAHSTPIDVVAEAPSSSARDYAPAARFVMMTNGMPLVGFKCAVAWCTFGTNAVADIPAPAHAEM